MIAVLEKSKTAIDYLSASLSSTGYLGNQLIHAICAAALRGQLVLHANEASQQQSGFLGVQCDVVPQLIHITRSFRFHHTHD